MRGAHRGLARSADERVVSMKYRKLGDSDLDVSEISLGSWLTYGVGVEADKARACLDEAFDQGINFIDTANIYGRGAAESFLGDALQGRDRDSYVLATKLFFPMTQTDRGLSARAGRKAARRIAQAPPHRLCRSLPMPPLRLRHPARGDDGGADPRRRKRQDPLHRLLRMARRPHQGRDRPRRRRPCDEVRLEPAAIFLALARAGGRGDPALRRQRHLADRLVAARPGRAQRQIRSGRAAAAGTHAPPATRWAASWTG